MKKIMIILLLLPMLGFGQEYRYHQNRYFSVSSEADVINLLDINKGINGYNGVLNVNFRSENTEFGISYEIFPNRYFWSIGAGGGFVVNPTNRFNVLIGAKLSLIWRTLEGQERGRDPSAAINVQPEYHFKNFYIFGRNELRYRGDIKALYRHDDDKAYPLVNSGFIGIGYKFNFKRR